MAEAPTPAIERLVLVDPQPALCEAWRAVFADQAAVTVVEGYFEDLEEFDCLVSPANSYGIMDGGVDLAIRRFFADIQDRVQERILADFLGYQPVGTSIMVPTASRRHPWLAHTPTMAVPMALAGPLVRNVYEAMWAMLCAAGRHNRDEQVSAQIRTLACPGLGTATGRVRPEVAARLMGLAYERHLSPRTASNWGLVEDAI